MNAFIDTNVSISYIFKIDSLNNKAKNVFREYENLYISDLVKEEIDEVFQEKRDILVDFFNELSKNLKSKKCIIISFKDLKDYLNQLDYTEEEYERVKSSLKKFWFDYINESFPKNQIVQTGVSKCLNDLDIFIFSKKEEMENMVNITEKRRKKYNVIKKELEKYNVHKKDIEIVLDAHDFNLQTQKKLDFITFDEDLFKGVLKIEKFSFKNIKGRNDFFARFN